MTDDVDLKDMVLSFAAQVARRCSEAVNGGGLAGGGMEDRIDAGGVEWSISASYDAGSDVVRVSGQPDRVDDQRAIEPHFAPGPGGMMLAFGMSPDEDAFDFRLPVAWLPHALVGGGE